LEDGRKTPDETKNIEINKIIRLLIEIRIDIEIHE
jgi:hypothetical protein